MAVREYGRAGATTARPGQPRGSSGAGSRGLGPRASGQHAWQPGVAQGARAGRGVRPTQSRRDAVVSARAGEAPTSPRSQTSPPAKVATSAEARDAASRLVGAGGSGTEADVEVVRQRLERLPSSLLRAAERAGVQAIACRGSVADCFPQLSGVHPRGHAPRITWDDLPSMYATKPGSHLLVVATQGGPDGQRFIAERGKGAGHSSVDPVGHEFGHAVDQEGLVPGQSSSSPEFQAAYDEDLVELEATASAQLRQPGGAGRQEAFAESFVRYFTRDATLRGELPALYAYWAWVEARLPSR
jgi:hypothetical protein